MFSKEKVQFIIIYMFDVFLAECQLHVIIHSLHAEFIYVYPVKSKRKRKCCHFDFRKYIGGWLHLVRKRSLDALLVSLSCSVFLSPPPPSSPLLSSLFVVCHLLTVLQDTYHSAPSHLIFLMYIVKDIKFLSNKRY